MKGCQRPVFLAIRHGLPVFRMRITRTGFVCPVTKYITILLQLEDGYAEMSGREKIV